MVGLFWTLLTLAVVAIAAALIWRPAPSNPPHDLAQRMMSDDPMLGSEYFDD